MQNARSTHDEEQLWTKFVEGLIFEKIQNFSNHPKSPLWKFLKIFEKNQNFSKSPKGSPIWKSSKNHGAIFYECDSLIGCQKSTLLGNLHFFLTYGPNNVTKVFEINIFISHANVPLNHIKNATY